MESLPPASSAHRRSDRVSIAFPLEIEGTDRAGQRFFDRTRTTTVSRYGCCIASPRQLQPDQTVHLRRIGTNENAVGRIVAAMGTHADGHLYGIETSTSCEALWGIRFSSSFYQKLLGNVSDGVYFVNRERKITYWNEAAQSLTGYASADAVGTSCFNNLLGHIDENGKPLCASGCPLSLVMLDGQPRTLDLYLRHKNGHRVPISVRALPLRNNEGKIVGAVEVFSDAAPRRNAEQRVSELEQLAFRDALTGLHNRRFLEMKVAQILEEHRDFGRLYGLLLVDTDRFKLVNDTHGHEVGDAVLKAVSATLVHGLRPVDMVGRWGGEEFLVLLPDLDAVRLGDLAERCRVLIAQSSVEAGASRVAVTASIGATVVTHSDSQDSLIRRADELMYQSKHAGGDRTTAG
ncbi:MAG TPA: diguanylate cyclase [Candidatus Dormibacteraeota bacterium]|nr:diguanylate cyclase [Candidatus Dormibacteraeota bacterium]